METHALQYGIWEYVDPEERAPKQLIMPTKSAKLTQPRIEEEWRRFKYNLDLNDWKELNNMYLRDRQNLRTLRSAIIQSVLETDIKDLAADCTEAREILPKLRARLSSSIESRINELHLKYNALQKAPRTRDLGSGPLEKSHA